MIIVDENGSSTLECCTGYQGCHCSNLSLALENIKNDTEIKLMSDISLEYVTQFGNISNVTITGHDHTVQCNHQGGLVGENIINIVIQNVTLDECNGNLTSAKLKVLNYVFQHPIISPTFILGGRDVVLIDNSVPLNNKTDNVTASTTQWQQQSNNCSDIMHYSDGDNCILLSCQNNTWLPPGFSCHHNNDLIVSQGYWYDNGLHHYVKICPNDYCNYDCMWWNVAEESHPDRDVQCKHNRGGYSCGECKDGYSIRYGTTDCIPSEHCLISSFPLSVLTLFAVSFFYWCLVIAFIFIVLHFNFNVTAGYAFGLIFYYSVLEQVFNASKQVYKEMPCSFIALKGNNPDCEPPPTLINILPFFSSIGNLKPPFMQYLKLCLTGTEMIDHMFLIYIHPLIVFSIVVTFFLSARRFVFVARFFGRFVNRKSISLLILLSYSSVSYTSVQLLRPLAYFKHNFNSHVESTGWRSYWSPHITYFHGRHAGYAAIAISCEVIIGFGFPFLLLFQRYLTRHHNINFMSIRPIIDQLQACYRNECYWFSTYYLLCRQVIYGVDIVCDLLLLGSSMNPHHYSVAKYFFLLMVCITIIVIHLWFQPYRVKSLNVLDGAILLTLVFMLVSSLDLTTYSVSLSLFILPLVLFINYLTYSTKVRHAIIFVSLCGLCLMILFFFYIYKHYFLPGGGGGVVESFCLIMLLCLLALHIIYISIRLVVFVIKYIWSIDQETQKSIC